MNCKDDRPTLFRVFDVISENGLTIQFQEFKIIGETPCFWYVMPSEQAYLSEIKGYEDQIKRSRKRVLKEQSGRRYCYTDKVKAMNSYLSRKHWQLSHAAMSEARAQAGIVAARAMIESGSIELPFTQPSDYIQGLNWDC